MEHTTGAESCYQTGGQIAKKIYSNEQRVLICNTFAKCHEKYVTDSFVKKIPTSALLCKTLHRMVERFPLDREARN
jgi:hypothetical protein